MKFRMLIAVLGLAALADLVAIPFMIDENHRTGTPPTAAIALSALLAVLTIVSMLGLTRGRGWAIILAITCRVVDLVSNALGVLAHPDAALTAGGVVGVLVSVAAIAMLVRQRQGLVLRQPG